MNRESTQTLNPEPNQLRHLANMLEASADRGFIASQLEGVVEKLKASSKNVVVEASSRKSSQDGCLVLDSSKAEKEYTFQAKGTALRGNRHSGGTPSLGAGTPSLG